MSTVNRDLETPPVEPPQKPPSIDKGPQRPAPTQAYDFKDYNPHVQVLYIRSLEQAKTALERLSKSGPFGFDIEWRPTYKKGAPENPVALIQLADDQHVLLFQVSCMREFPEGLKQILENSRIIKAGVGIQGDAKKLFKDCKVSMGNCVDLALLARTVDNAQWAGIYDSPIGLARLIERYEYRLLLKGKISRSDWASTLSRNQQDYAGNDAHAGYTLYKRFAAMMLPMTSQPEAGWYSFNVHEGNFRDGEGLLWKAENPNYDPGLEWEQNRKQKREESHTAEAQVLPEPVIETQLHPTSSVENRICSSNWNFISVTPSAANQASRLASVQMSARNHVHDRRFQSIQTNETSTRISAPSTDVSHPRRFVTYPDTRCAHPEMPAGRQHGNSRRMPLPSYPANRISSVSTRDNVASTRPLRANP